MVVEELIAKLGFKTDGLGELKKYEDGLKRVRKSIADFGTAANKSLASGASSLAGKSTAALTAATAAAKNFGRALMSTVASMALMATGIAGAIGLVAKLAMNFARARGEAAKLRREQQLSAGGKRTTVGNLENFGKGLSAVSGGVLGKDQAEEFVGAIAEKANEAITSKDYSTFKGAGISVLHPNGVQRDSTAVAADVVGKLLGMLRAGQIARREADIETNVHGNKKKAAAAEAESNKQEFAAREFAKKFGITDKMLAALLEFRGTAEQFAETMKQAAAANPAPTSEDEARKKELTAAWDQLRNRAEGVANALLRPLERIADKLAIDVIGPLDKLMTTIAYLLKKAGIMDETKDEADQREARNAQEQKSLDGLKKQSEASKEKPSILTWLFGMGTPGQAAKQELDTAVSRYESARQNRDMAATPQGAEVWTGIMKQILEQAQEAAQKLRDIKEKTSPDKGAEKGAKDAGKKAENNYDQRKYSDIGNDQRTQTANVTVNATGLDAVAAKVKAAVLGAMSTKSASTSTAALTSS